MKISRENHPDSWIQTSTGRKFFPLDPRPEEVHVEDIAAGLSLEYRYSGQTRTPSLGITVAEHSCRLCDYASARHPENSMLIFQALMHDAPEAYVSDVTRPVKKHFPAFEMVERGIWLAVCERFGIEPTLPKLLEEWDRRICLDERDASMAEPPEEWSTRGPKLGVRFEFWHPLRAKEEFLQRFRRISKKFI